MQHHTIFFLESCSLGCLNRMIAVGLKGPSVRGALRQSKRQHMWEVPNKTSLINLFSVCSNCVAYNYTFANSYTVFAFMCLKNDKFAGNLRGKWRVPKQQMFIFSAFSVDSNGCHNQVKGRVEGVHSKLNVVDLIYSLTAW